MCTSVPLSLIYTYFELSTTINQYYSLFRGRTLSIFPRKQKLLIVFLQKSFQSHRNIYFDDIQNGSKLECSRLERRSIMKFLWLKYTNRRKFTEEFVISTEKQRSKSWIWHYIYIYIYIYLADLVKINYVSFKEPRLRFEAVESSLLSDSPAITKWEMPSDLSCFWNRSPKIGLMPYRTSSGCAR